MRFDNFASRAPLRTSKSRTEPDREGGGASEIHSRNGLVGRARRSGPGRSGGRPGSGRGARMLRALGRGDPVLPRSEEHTSELQSLMRISYAVFCLKKKKNKQLKQNH